MKVSIMVNCAADNNVLSNVELVSEVMEYTNEQAPVVGYYTDGYTDENVPFRRNVETGQFYIRTYQTPDDLAERIVRDTQSSIIYPYDFPIDTPTDMLKRILDGNCERSVIVDGEVFDPCMEPLYKVSPYEVIFTVDYVPSTVLRVRGYYNVNEFKEAMAEFERDCAFKAMSGQPFDYVTIVYATNPDAFTFYPSREREQMQRYQRRVTSDAIRLVNDTLIMDAVTELEMPDGTKVRVTIDVDIAWPKDEWRD